MSVSLSQPNRVRRRGESSTGRYERTVGKDHVVSLGEGITIQLPPLPHQRGYAGRKVEVAQQPDGRLLVYWERRLLME